MTKERKADLILTLMLVGSGILSVFIYVTFVNYFPTHNQGIMSKFIYFLGMQKHYSPYSDDPAVEMAMVMQGGSFLFLYILFMVISFYIYPKVLGGEIRR